MEEGQEELLPQPVGSQHERVQEDVEQGVRHELEREISKMVAFRRPLWKMIIYYTLGICTGGILFLVSLWSTKARAYFQFSSCSLEDADVVFVQLKDKRSALCEVHRVHPSDSSTAHQPPSSSPSSPPPLRYFTFHTVRFLYLEGQRCFVAVPSFPRGLAGELQGAKGEVMKGRVPGSPPAPTRSARAVQYGDNLLAVDMPSFALIFLHDALQPFYCFQYASVILWTYEAYYLYSFVVLVITMASILTNCITQYKERKRMAEMAYYMCELEVVVGGGPLGRHTTRLLPSSCLLPGDVVVVTTGKVAVDLLLLEGECIVDETVLTGESVPVRKVCYDLELDARAAAPGAPFSLDPLNHCTLFNGTTVAAVRGGEGEGGRPVLGLVAATSFNTAKGRLLRTIMFPRQHDLQFAKEASIFIVVMLAVAIAFYVWDIVSLVRFGVGAEQFVVKAFDMITVAVPPALACCLAIAITISVARLRRRDIFVMDNERVTLAGLLDHVCFDKTGTLTEIGLEFGGVIPTDGERFGERLQDPLGLPQMVQTLFATCHGLTQLEDTVVGDPLDQRLFEVAGFDMKFEEQGGEEGGLAPPTTTTTTSTPAASSAPRAPASRLVVRKRYTLDAAVQAAEAAAVAARPRPLPSLRSPALSLAPATTSAIDDRPLISQGSGGYDPDTEQYGYSLDPHTLHPSYGPPRLPHSTATPDSPGHDHDHDHDHSMAYSHAHTSYSQRYGHPGSSHEAPRALAGQVYSGHGSPQQQQPPHAVPAVLEPVLDLAKGLPLIGDLLEIAQDRGPQLETVGALAHQHPQLTDPKHRAILLSHAQFPQDASYVVLRRFDFSSERLRSTCAVRYPDGQLVVFVKGSPEKLLTFVDPASVPDDYATKLQACTNQGLRVLGMAMRLLPQGTSEGQALGASQDELEAGAHFMGLVLMVNRLKPESRAVIQHLARASIASAMVTGDHVRTAVSVARQCDILEEGREVVIADLGKGPVEDAELVFEVVDAQGNAAPAASGPEALRAVADGSAALALTGRAFQRLHRHSQGRPDLQEVMELALQRAAVWARMSPDDKRSLVEMLGPGEVDSEGALRPGQGYYVGYCGDGANDLGALKGALVGVSLCDAEASVAAPMTSRDSSIHCMVRVVAEGRCSLVTSLIIFKYTMVYAFIQVLSLGLLYSQGLMVGNYQYLLQDMFHTTLLASCMALTDPAATLSRQRPLSRVMSLGVALPVLAQLALCTAFQLLALALLKRQPWFTPFDTAAPGAPILDIEFSQSRPESGVLFVVSCWQLIILALVFNVGRPFRRELWTNAWLLGALLVLIGFDLYIIWGPGDPFKRTVPAVCDMPLEFRGRLFGLVASNLMAAYTLDYGVHHLYLAGKRWFDARAGPSQGSKKLVGQGQSNTSRMIQAVEMQVKMGSGATLGHKEVEMKGSLLPEGAIERSDA